MDSQNFYSELEQRILQIQQEKGIVGDKPYWQKLGFPPFPEVDEDLQNIDNENNSTSLIEEELSSEDDSSSALINDSSIKSCRYFLSRFPESRFAMTMLQRAFDFLFFWKFPEMVDLLCDRSNEWLSLVQPSY